MNGRISTIVNSCLILVCLSLWIVDLAMDDRLSASSADLSIYIQHNFGQWITVLSKVLSSVGVYWFILFLYVYILMHCDIIYMLYNVSLYLMALSTAIILKALYYRGRPFAMSSEIEGCECDPGMPSGHATMSVVTYWITYELVRVRWIEKVLTPRKKMVCKVLLGAGCIVVSVGVILSRIALGVHTYSQVVLGFFLGLLYVVFLTYDAFVWILRRVWNKLKMISFVYGVSLVVFTVAMMIINHAYREKPDEWKYLHKCESCFNSFVKGQTQSLSIVLFLPSFWFYFQFVERLMSRSTSPAPSVTPTPIPVVIKSPLQDIQAINSASQHDDNMIKAEKKSSILSKRQIEPDNRVNSNMMMIENNNNNNDDEDNDNNNPNNESNQQIDHNVMRGTHSIVEVYEGRSSTKEIIIRLLIYLLSSVPSILVYIIYEYILKNPLRRSYSSPISQSIIVLIVNGITTLYLGAATTLIKNKILLKIQYLTKNDTLDVNMLMIDNITDTKINHRDMLSIDIHAHT